MVKKIQKEFKEACLTDFDLPKQKLSKIKKMIEEYGSFDGSDHKQWLLDQVMRIIEGDNYENWAKESEWEVGIAP